jgi:hypothetical protein
MIEAGRLAPSGLKANREKGGQTPASQFIVRPL